ncbi:PD-(D/E)XK nuclease family protein [Advenella mimigardefordensis]|uniref:Putative DNA repair protein n=1 Tax=Advenella mimigardefordensis (strain DSM 17166 / LMG 22922 / DPN7) TaxID=1247726 RepID=W0PD75_ADVMD|nr:PD-(D/E)XK nuclease family protein [Advenella mimigardefordensis]AHG64686.1 putative DNA repair protein [Advenella mimigardefordensis DPN7]
MACSIDAVTPETVASLDPETTVVVTVNNRLVWRVHALLLAQARQGSAVLQLPAASSLAHWLDQLHQERLFCVDPTVRSHRLSAFAARLLWEEVVASMQGETPLIDVQLAAARAMAASHDRDEWDVQVQPQEQTEEYLRFKQWRNQYEQRCRELDAQDDNHLYNTLIDSVEAGRLSRLPATVVLAGFNEYSPRLTRLLQACASRGCQLVSLSLPRHEQSQRTLSTQKDRSSEWIAAAHWAAGELAADPLRRVAIVSPAMEADAVFARRILDRELSADPLIPPYGYNMSVGRALAEWPVVFAAFRWLSLIAGLCDQGVVRPQQFGQALLAGFCSASAVEQSAMAVLDARLRESQNIEWHTDQVCAQMDRHASDFSYVFRQAIAHWQQAASGGRQDTEHWTQAIRETLALLGFPGSTLSSTNYQVCKAFDELLHTFSLLNLYAGRLSGGSAVALLQRMAREAMFQPQRDPNVRLDVLGFLEAEHGQWDAVWVLGLTDDVIPASPDPNPFLPVAALARAGAPRATPEREKAWAIDMLQALCGVAPQVVLSHPASEADRALRPSPLLSFFVGASAGQGESVGVSECLSRARCAALPLETLSDNRGLPLTKMLEGGSDLLETQALNPLWGYVRYRLLAKGLRPYPESLNAAIRGTFLHSMAQKVWEMLGSSERLLQLDQNAQSELVTQAVAMAADQTLNGVSPALAAMEKARGHAVMMTLLDLERERPPFHVMGVEQAAAWQHASVKVNLRVDRIDETEQGAKVVMDYKSGQRTPDFQKDWLRPQPINLQLPLYATVLRQADAAGQRGQIEALLFAKLNAKKTEFNGLGENGSDIAGITSLAKLTPEQSWEALLDGWERSLEQLARDISEGVADNRSWTVNDLMYCDVLPFLRLAQESEDD